MSPLLLCAVAVIGGVVVLAPLFVLLASYRRGAGIRYDDSFRPTVCIITPMFNEGATIRRTLASLVAQDYPADRVEIIVVDDCSTDDSYDHAVEALRGVANARVVRNPRNLGKRRSINRAVAMTQAEIIVSVDSDVVVEPAAVRQMIRCFTSPRIAAVGGRVAIVNELDNWLTRMQAVKYYFSYFLIKRVEMRFRSVLCLSGCLTAYRRTVLEELSPVLENRSMLGVEIKYGEDRYLTRMIVKAGYETIMNVHAVCRTTAPTSLSVYLSQQLRWRRSNMVDYLGAMSHLWKGHPAVAIYIFSLFLGILLYPTLLVSAALTGGFWGLMIVHLVVAFLFGVGYRLHAHKDPNASAWHAIPLAFVFPLTYGILTPLALFTLDAGGWETRGHQPELEPATDAVPVLVPVPVELSRPLEVLRPEPVLRSAEAIVRPMLAPRGEYLVAAQSVRFATDRELAKN